MLSSTGVGEEEEPIILNPVTSSTSSKSSSSSPSPLMPRTMEEVWRNINLASIQSYSANPRRQSTPHSPNFIVQDFFPRPVHPPTSANGEATMLVSPVPPHPATVLSLDYGPGFGFPQENSRLRSNSVPNSANCNCLFRALTTTARLGSSGKKRAQDSDSGSRDQQYKKLLKSRESAARSRDKKKVYTKELESEVQKLKKENARLKKQLCRAAAGKLHKKHRLERTSTAPF